MDSHVWRRVIRGVMIAAGAAPGAAHLAVGEGGPGSVRAPTLCMCAHRTRVCKCGGCLYLQRLPRRRSRATTAASLVGRRQGPPFPSGGAPRSPSVATRAVARAAETPPDLRLATGKRAGACLSRAMRGHPGPAGCPGGCAGFIVVRRGGRCVVGGGREVVRPFANGRCVARRCGTPVWQDDSDGFDDTRMMWPDVRLAALLAAAGARLRCPRGITGIQTTRACAPSITNLQPDWSAPQARPIRTSTRCCDRSVCLHTDPRGGDGYVACESGGETSGPGHPKAS